MTSQLRHDLLTIAAPLAVKPVGEVAQGLYRVLTDQLLDMTTSPGGHPVGTRIRFIADEESYGTVVSPVFAGEFGTPRQRVRWDRSGEVTAWTPAFLLPIDEPTPELIVTTDGMVFMRDFGGVFRIAEMQVTGDRPCA